ncbi:MAG: hypothetical protein AAB493_00120 [Patescibacteria group bacterium]
MDIVDSINSTFYPQNTEINPNLLNPDYLFNQITAFFKSFYESTDFILIGNIINIVFFIIAIVSIFIICYSVVRIFEIRKKEHKYLQYELEEYARKQVEKEKKDTEKNGSTQSIRWGGVLQHLSSENPGDWKLAIMDADSMLEDLLDQLGFKGENLGEKLKLVDMEKYSSLKSAWDAHIVRNKIAHEGIQFEISQQEAKRAIAIYEQIFRDFRYI